MYDRVSFALSEFPSPYLSFKNSALVKVFELDVTISQTFKAKYRKKLKTNLLVLRQFPKKLLQLFYYFILNCNVGAEECILFSIVT